MLLELSIGAFALAAFVTLLVARELLRSARAKKLFERDVNKPGKPLTVAGHGGFAIYAGIATALGVALIFLQFVLLPTISASASPLFDSLYELLAVLASISILALVGAFDDLFKLSRATKIYLPLVGALPLVAINAGTSAMTIPFLGVVDLGWLYAFLIMPLGVTGAANAVNMAAGYNGLEAGIGFVVSLFLLPIAIASGSFTASIILACLAGACLAFLYYNWSPAKIFVGDVGTYVIGGAIAAAAITGHLQSFAVLAILPAFYELAATFAYSFRGVERRPACHNPVLLDSQGRHVQTVSSALVRGPVRIQPPTGAEHFTLMYRILAWRPLTESRLVLTTLALYAACGLAALALYAIRA